MVPYESWSTITPTSQWGRGYPPSFSELYLVGRSL